MASIFDVANESLFSILASKNRRLYFSALMVLRDIYRRELQIRRSDLVVALVASMERQMMEWDVSEDGVPGGEVSDEGPEETETLSGRAHLLVRRLVETGWLQTSTDHTTFEEVLEVPDYAAELLETFYRIVHPEEKPYHSFVYNTYAALKTADEERDEFMFQALRGAFDNTAALRDSLRSLLHNMRQFYQNLQHRQEVRELLAEHFDQYQVEVALKTYHPLKTVDSVHRFRPRILQFLRRWIQDPQVLEQLHRSMRLHRGGRDDADDRVEILRMIDFIRDSYQSMDGLLREIDRRNSNYSRAAAERLQYLLNTDRDIKGKLIEVLKALPPLDKAEETPILENLREVLPVYRVAVVEEGSLYREPKARRREQPQPLRERPAEAEKEFEAELQEMRHQFRRGFSRREVVAFLMAQLGERDRIASGELKIGGVEDFIRVILAVVRADEPDVPYRIAWKEGTVRVGAYRLPQFEVIRVVSGRGLVG
ncbi:MAG: hypothetical protein IRY98_04675 [Alicyclobacillaceae bacterium]|nr:hypothetical protein [Alicyclobacillaceae bacterium]